MNRIATRAMAILLLVVALMSGCVFFLCEYVAESGKWVTTLGSPHVYSDGKISTGAITDRSGQLLVDLTKGRVYSDNANVRRSVLHWVGDRQGNIRAPFVDYYANALLGYDFVSGIYTYGNTNGNIQLTLSAKTQAEALAAMDGRVGTVAVYNYQTGEILCAVSTPTFDPNNVPDIAGDTTGAYTGVYLNRFIQSKYIPGSIFKVATLTAALESIPGIEHRTFHCDGVYEIQNGDITCLSAHGTQTLKECFSNSCNCAFAQIVEIMGRDTLASYVNLFGITSPVSFDGITTVSGNFDVENATGEQVAWSGIGQHKDQINPCAYLRFIGAIARGGIGAEPYLVSRITVGDATTYQAKTTHTQRLLSGESARILREYMGNNVTVKYGKEHFHGLTVCAKSGTAEVGGGRKPNALFTGFVADEQYPLAFIVVVEDGGFGAQTCIPIISRILQVCTREMTKN